MIVSESIEWCWWPVPSDDDIESFCDKIKNKNPSHVFLTAVWEAYGFIPALLKLDTYMRRLNIPTTFVINHWSKNDTSWNSINSTVVFLDFFLWRSYNEALVKGIGNLNQQWNPSASKFLFLVGKPEKEHRAGLVYRLLKEQLLDRCSYSFYIHPSNYNNVRAVMSALTDDEFNEFVRNTKKKLDDTVIVDKTDSIDFVAIDTDPALYSNSLFRLVSETYIDQRDAPWITEKTWMTIANKSPFIIVGNPESCKHLNNLGISTFDTLFDIPTYDTDPDYSSRINKILLHIKKWLANEVNKSHVNDLIERNYKQFVNSAVFIKNSFEHITGVSIDQVIDTRHIGRRSPTLTFDKETGY